VRSSCPLTADLKGTEMVLRNLARRKVRTSLTVLGVALSIGATVALFGISTGLVSQVSAVVSAAGSELTVVQRIPQGLTFGYLGSIPASTVEGLRNLPDVAMASPLVLIPATIRRDIVFLVYGVDPTGPEVSRVHVVEGRPLRPGDGAVVMLGARAADGMGKRVGDSITVNARDLRVIGIYESGISLEEGGAMMALSAARELFGLGDRVSLVKVKVKDPRRVRPVQEAIEARFPEVTAITSEEFARDRLNLEAVIAGAWAVSAVALLLSVLAVANTMAMAVLERTREIGILLAVGWSRRRIVGLIAGEAVVMSLLGGLVGITLGTAALNALSRGYKTLPFPSTVGPELLAGAVSLALFVGVFGGLLPAWRASTLDPVEALRSE
jgi:putative ABC transport system permease protein